MNNPSVASERLANAIADLAATEALASNAGFPLPPVSARMAETGMSGSADSLVAAKKQAFKRLARHLDLLESTPPTPNGMRRLTGRVLAWMSTQLAKFASPDVAAQPTSTGPGDSQ